MLGTCKLVTVLQRHACMGLHTISPIDVFHELLVYVYREVRRGGLDREREKDM